MDSGTPVWIEELTRSRTLPGLGRFSFHIENLPAGDRVLLGFFGLLVAIASISGVYKLEKSLLILTPAYGGTLVEGAVGSPQFMNPLLAISDADRDLTTLTYAGLMGLSGDGSLIPVVAESYNISEDGKTYVFTLRNGVKFSDGTPLTSADIVFTVEKAQDSALKSPEYAAWSGVRAEAVDSQTVRFTLAKPYAPFLGLTTLGILPSRLWQNISTEQFPFSPLEINPVGEGPFKVSSVTKDAGLIRSVTLVANPNYPLGRPYLDSIRFNFYTSSEDLASALRSGEIESAYDTPSAHELKAPYARVFGVFWNPNQKQVYSRLEVRKALSIALDRQSIVDTVLGGYATPLMGPVPPGGSVTQVAVPESSDRIKDAAAILTTAGWSYDGTARVWKNAGAKQTLDSITLRTSNVAELKNVATAVKATWEKLGIPVTIELYEPGDLSQNVIRPRSYEALLYGMVIGRDQDLYAFWDSQERNDPGLNIALYANKTVDALLEGARVSSLESTRTDDLQNVENTVAADYPAAFLYAPNFTYSVPQDLRGIELPQVVLPADRFATVAMWYRSTDAVWPFFIKK
ncbi:MAG: family 5 extracellular solute-binding protein peptide/nickel transport system substrate-binding [Parcubacteria group bacterium]|nr:family 5 extracellular solute-binding protein peptide/nickel transport system substrate-binding [Parcubacteria group bacterium]